MPPPNDDLANAQDLGSAIPQSVTWSNIGATSEVGEPANNGATIWFKWTNRIKTTPVGLAGAADYVGAAVTFGTRFKPGQSSPTAIPTVVTVYRTKSYNPGFSDLVFAARSSAGWGWSGQSQVTVDVGAFNGDPSLYGAGVIPDVLYIRIDGNILPGGSTAEGTGTLWVEKWWENAPFGCGNCAPSTDLADGVCLLSWQPSIFTTGTKIYDAGSIAAPPGTYMMRCCHGAWSYDSNADNHLGATNIEQPHWVVSAIPPGGDQNWSFIPGFGEPPLYPGYFFGWSFTYNGGQNWCGHLNDGITAISGTTTAGDTFGYWTPLQANNGGVCQTSTFQHDGQSKIVMAFTDQEFDDNSHWYGTGSDPVFSLSVIQPDFTALTACSSKVSTNVYDVQFTVQNNNPYTWTGVSATCLLTGGVTASNTTSPGTYVANGQTTVTVRITIDPTLNRNINATLNLTDNYGMNVNLVYNLYPIVVITLVSKFNALCGGYTKEVQYQAKVLGIAMDNLVGTVSSPDVASFANQSCVSTTSEAVGATDCNNFDFPTGTGPIELKLNNPTGTTATVTIAWTDGALTFSSSVINLTGL